MQAREVLHKLMVVTCGEMHVMRRQAVETMVWAGLTSQRMTVTGLGRAIGGGAREKHNIKRADRLLSNAHLQLEREAMYGVLAHRKFRGDPTVSAHQFSSFCGAASRALEDRCRLGRWSSLGAYYAV